MSYFHLTAWVCGRYLVEEGGVGGDLKKAMISFPLR
jgi:hypothetical protein